MVVKEKKLCKHIKVACSKYNHDQYIIGTSLTKEDIVYEYGIRKEICLNLWLIKYCFSLIFSI